MAREYIPIIILNFTGIKCDTPDCGWHKDDVQSKDYRLWVNVCCPNCDANLLTQKDFIATNQYLKAVDLVNNVANRWFPMWLLKMLKPNPNNPKHARSAEMNGSGKLKFKRKDS